ncbi:MAG: hypothetical protein IKD69_11590 [Solobacterium sp.]|nr:hypothetical protein [Solobacterium sp.]
MKKTICLLLSACLLAGCSAASVSQTPGPSETSEHHETPQPVNASDPLVLVKAELPEKQGEGEDYLYTDAYFEWLQNWNQKAREATEAAAATIPFTAAMIQAIQAGEENNVCAPLNLFEAMSMLAEVTAGNTRKEILDVLGVSDLETLRAVNQKILTANSANLPHLASLPGASFWLDDHHTYHEDCLQGLADTYKADAYAGTMGSESYNELLRQWLNDHTGGLLGDSVKEQSFQDSTVLALVTSFYLKAGFVQAFDEALTDRQMFHAATGDIEVDMMHQTERMQLAGGDGWQAVGLDLQDSGMLWAVLPAEGSSVEALSAHQVLNTLQNGENRRYEEVRLSLPKFDVSASGSWIETFETLGIHDAFDDRADFSPVCDDPLSVASITHAARVKAYETGLEAAAFTVIMTEESEAIPDPDPVQFVVDRPFLFLISGHDGSVLFAGNVQNPAG